jgi:hypothetical protein
MNVLGKPPRAPTAEEVLEKVCAFPPNLRGRLLKTMVRYGLLSDGAMLSALRPEEREAVDRVHLDALAADSRYSAAEPFDLRQALPRQAGVRLRQVRFAEAKGGRKLAVLEVGPWKVAADALPVATLLARHPGAVWRAGCEGDNPAAVLLEEGGFFEGRLLGSVRGVFVEECTPPAARLRRRVKGGSVHYVPAPREE